MVNIQNAYDNECFKCSKVRYLTPIDRNPTRITKAGKNFAKNLDFKDIELPAKIRDIQKIQENSIDISVFSYKNKEKNPICVSKKRLKKNMLIYY